MSKKVMKFHAHFISIQKTAKHFHPVDLPHTKKG